MNSSTGTSSPAAAFAAAVKPDGDEKSPDDTSGSIPLLPEPGPNSNLKSYKLGETIRFEEMGPVIINTDGTTRRIANWDQLTKHEQEVSWRRISKRNEQRRKILLEEQQKNEADEEEDL